MGMGGCETNFLPTCPLCCVFFWSVSLAMPCGIQDLISLTRDRTHTPSRGRVESTTGWPGSYLIYIFRMVALPALVWAVGGQVQGQRWEAIAVVQAGVNEGLTEGGR